MDSKRAAAGAGPFHSPTSQPGSNAPRTRGLFFLAGVILFLLLGGGLAFHPAAGAGPPTPPEKLHRISLNGLQLQVELARTKAEKALGLGGRTSLEEGRGMLFLYSDHRVRSFWMAGMKISIDLLWLKNGEVVGVEARLPVPLQGRRPRTVTSPVAVNAVLEVPAGWADRHGIGPGAKITGP